MYQAHKKGEKTTTEEGESEEREWEEPLSLLTIMSYFSPKQTGALSKRKLIRACVKRVAIEPQGTSTLNMAH